MKECELRRLYETKQQLFTSYYLGAKLEEKGIKVTCRLLTQQQYNDYYQPFPNFFERDPNLNLLKASQPMPQTTYDKNYHFMDDF